MYANHEATCPNAVPIARPMPATRQNKTRPARNQLHYQSTKALYITNQRLRHLSLALT